MISGVSLANYVSPAKLLVTDPILFVEVLPHQEPIPDALTATQRKSSFVTAATPSSALGNPIIDRTTLG